MTVIDSGVLVDLELGLLTIDRLGRDALVAPHLVDSEFMQAVRGLVVGGIVDQRNAEHMIRRFGELEVERFPAQSLASRVWELRHNLTASDATYVALAESLGTSLVTTDACIGRAPGIRCPVEVL